MHNISCNENVLNSQLLLKNNSLPEVPVSVLSCSDIRFVLNALYAVDLYFRGANR